MNEDSQLSSVTTSEVIAFRDKTSTLLLGTDKDEDINKYIELLNKNNCVFMFGDNVYFCTICISPGHIATPHYTKAAQNQIYTRQEF